MELPKKKELTKGDGWSHENTIAYGFNECHDQYTKAMIERLARLPIKAHNKVGFVLVRDIDQLIKELK